MNRLRIHLTVTLVSVVFAASCQKEQAKLGPENVSIISITLDKAGTLSNNLKDWDSIRGLKISGPINGDDFRLIRKMCGKDEKNNNTDGVLSVLDLSDVRVVAGGGSYFYSYDVSENDIIPDWVLTESPTIAEVILPNTINKIGIGAFQKCSKLKSINIPEHIQVIDAQAFFECLNLSGTLEFPPTLKNVGRSAFYQCKKVDITTLRYLERINDFTFSSCRKLSNLEFSEKLDTIGSYAFQDTPSLNEASLPKALKHVGSGAFYKSGVISVTINSDLTSSEDILDKAAFENCEYLVEVIVSEGVRMLGVGFRSCKNLKEVNLPKSLKSIGYGEGYTFFDLVDGEYTMDKVGWVLKDGEWQYDPRGKNLGVYDKDMYGIGGRIFTDCSSLKSIELPVGLLFVADYTFSGCSSLEKIQLPDSLESTGACLFKDCISLKSIILPSGLLNIGNKTFNGCTSLQSVVIPETVELLGYEAFSGCVALNDITIPDSVVEIGSGAFKECPALEYMAIPGKVKKLETETFMGCTSLSDVSLPEDLLAIEASAFHYCPALKEVKIPSRVNSIEDNAFSYTGLKNVIVSWTVPLSIPNSVFDHTNLRNSTLTVPSGTEKLYSNESPWNLFGTIEARE